MTASLKALAADLDALPEPERHAVAARLAALDRRAELIGRYRHAGDLAAAVDPAFKLTPALELIASSVERTITEPRRNLLVTVPPQEGKSTLCAVWAPLRALQRNPDTRVILATYADGLAEDHSRAARGFVQTAGTGATDALTGADLPDRLGFSLAHDRSAVSGWRVHGHKGGMIAVGLGSSITGRPADLLIIDDPFKNMQEADSAAHRRKVLEWFRSVALTRLSPSASVVLIQTRWHPEDLAGQVLAAEAELDPSQRTWRHLNIPAVAEPGIPDALGREPGTPMESARGRTPADWQATRQQVGERVWYALYQGVPAPPEGGLFARGWFTEHRATAAPERPAAIVVGVDPADSGEGDEAGIIAGAIDEHGTVTLTHDWSAQLTSDQWARRAVTLALTVGASEVAVEGYTVAKTYERVVREAWKTLRAAALAKRAAGADLDPIEQRLTATARPPFRIHMWRKKGDAAARSAALSQAFETGRARLLGDELATLEEQAATWQAGQHQPDRLAAAVICHDRLMETVGTRSVVAAPAEGRITAQASGRYPWLQRTLPSR